LQKWLQQSMWIFETWITLHTYVQPLWRPNVYMYRNSATFHSDESVWIFFNTVCERYRPIALMLCHLLYIHYFDPKWYQCICFITSFIWYAVCPCFLEVGSSIKLSEEGQRTFPAKTFPERCYGSDVWYPKSDVLVPHDLPPIPYSSTTYYLPSPSISYFSTTSQPLLTPIPKPKRDGGREGRERAPHRDHHVSPATTSRVRRTSFRRTDRPLPPVASRRFRVRTREQ